MKKENRLGLRTWIEINKKAIAYNYRLFRSLISVKTKLMGVVKSNAYGHNLIEFSQELEKLGTDYLAVDSIVEGLALRKEGIKIPILILGYILPEMIEKAAINNIDITISNFDYFTKIKKLNLKKPVHVHIKVDSGMRRHGFYTKDIKKVIIQSKILEKLGKIKIVGLYTHFASAKNPAFPIETKKQIEIFNEWSKSFKEQKINVILHASATSGTLLFPEAHFDMVRIGIGLYGLWPSQETKMFCQNKFSLKPVLVWKTIIGEIKNVEAEDKIGYDFTEKLNKKSKIAIIPIGYWHGYPRALSSIGQVLIKGEKAKVVGRICMDILMIDITSIKDVKIGDEVTIIGPSGNNEITVDNLATLLEASSYEFITRINPLIKKIYY